MRIFSSVKLLIVVFLFISFCQCKKESNNNSSDIQEFITFKFKNDDLSFIFKPEFALDSEINSVYDTISKNTKVEFLKSNIGGDRVTVLLKNIDLAHLIYPYQIPSNINSMPFGNNNIADIYFMKNYGDSIYQYDLTTDNNSHISLDYLDNHNFTLIGEFAGKMFGHKMGEAVFQITDSIYIGNGHFKVKLKN